MVGAVPPSTCMRRKKQYGSKSFTLPPSQSKPATSQSIHLSPPMNTSPSSLDDGFSTRSSSSNASSSCSVYSSESSVPSSSSDDAPLITRRSINRRVDRNSADRPPNISIPSPPPAPIDPSTIHPHTARKRGGGVDCNSTDIAPRRLHDSTPLLHDRPAAQIHIHRWIGGQEATPGPTVHLAQAIQRGTIHRYHRGQTRSESRHCRTGRRIPGHDIHTLSLHVQYFLMCGRKNRKHTYVGHNVVGRGKYGTKIQRSPGKPVIQSYLGFEIGVSLMALCAVINIYINA